MNWLEDFVTIIQAICFKNLLQYYFFESIITIIIKGYMLFFIKYIL